MITVYKKTLTPTEVKNGNTTPILILPAPAEGYVRNIFGATERIVPGEVSYDGVTSTSLTSTLESIPEWANGFIMGDQTVEHSRAFINAGTPGLILSTEDPVYWYADADSTVGDGEYSVIIVYEDKLIPVS